VLAIGTRPEAIKLAPVADALRGRGIEPLLLFTGQHPLDPGYYCLESFAAVRLDCPGGGEPHAHAARVAAAVLPLLDETCLVIVQGDTSSALGAALAAAAAQVPLAHVEAGLRSHDRQRPWPEEEFRVTIDRQAQLLFAPTELSAANLRRERVSGSIHVTGNSGIDAVLRLQRGSKSARPVPGRMSKLLVTCHRRESWGLGLAGIAGALRSIAEQQIASIDLLLHPNPATAAHVRALLLGCEGVTLHPPLGHRATIAAMLEADYVLSDSGGIQEECAALGIPLLVLRERTERPEAIACGKMMLVGTEPERIIDAVRTTGRSRRDPLPGDQPYGDGVASGRIAVIVADWLQGTSGAVGRIAGPPTRLALEAMSRDPTAAVQSD
jgi:UDP-N-acetylglucosamine 2-epimerase (non-hydrolysing)